MLFPLHCQTGRVQSEDAQAHLDRQLYKVLLPTQAFQFCSSHLTAVAILIRVSPSPLPKPTLKWGRVSQSQVELLTIGQGMAASTLPLHIVRFRLPPRSLRPKSLADCPLSRGSPDAGFSRNAVVLAVLVGPRLLDLSD